MKKVDLRGDVISLDVVGKISSKNQTMSCSNNSLCKKPDLIWAYANEVQ